MQTRFLSFQSSNWLFMFSTIGIVEWTFYIFGSEWDGSRKALWPVDILFVFVAASIDRAPGCREIPGWSTVHSIYPALWIFYYMVNIFQEIPSIPNFPYQKKFRWLRKQQRKLLETFVTWMVLDWGSICWITLEKTISSLAICPTLMPHLTNISIL